MILFLVVWLCLAIPACALFGRPGPLRRIARNAMLAVVLIAGGMAALVQGTHAYNRYEVAHTPPIGYGCEDGCGSPAAVAYRRACGLPVSGVNSGPTWTYMGDAGTP